MTDDNYHPSFLQPDYENIKVWRYMDFAKFVSMIKSKSLFLNRVDSYPEDPIEGTIPENNKEISKHMHPYIDTFYIQNVQSNEELRKRAFVNCWHMNDYESIAMWKLYTNTIESVTIETTYSKLKSILPEDFFIGLVEYIDYKKETINTLHTPTPFMYKGKEYIHESEVRILNMEVKSEGGQYKFNEKELKTHKFIENLDINDLINKIYVHPKSQEWFFELVKEICSTCGINSDKVRKSNLT